MLLIQTVLSLVSFIDINPFRQGATALDLDKDGFVSESFGKILYSNGYSESTLNHIDSIKREIGLEKDPLRQAELKLALQFSTLKATVDSYDYNKKVQDIHEITADKTVTISNLLGKYLYQKYNRKAVCSFGNFRFPPNPSSYYSQANYATSLLHIDGFPKLRERIEGSINFLKIHAPNQSPDVKSDYDEVLANFKPLVGKKTNWLSDRYDMINIWMPLNNGEVQNFPLAFREGQLKLSDFGLWQRILTMGRPLVYFPNGNYKMCYWDKMKFGDFFLFKSLKIAHEAIDLNKILKEPFEKREANRKSFEMRCFMEKDVQK